MRSNLCNLICLRHSLRSGSVTNIPIFLHACCSYNSLCLSEPLCWKLYNCLTGKLTGNSLVNFPVKVNRKSELTGIHLKVSSTGILGSTSVLKLFMRHLRRNHVRANTKLKEIPSSLFPLDQPERRRVGNKQLLT